MTVWLNVFELGALEARRPATRAWRLERHRHDRDPIGRALGAAVYATAGSAEKCRRCESLGALRAINYREEDFVAVIEDLAGKRASMSCSTWSAAII